jgi:hypothetical protein
MDRRAIFFACAAVVLALLTPVAPGEFRRLTLGLAAVYVLLGIASFADWRSQGNHPLDRPDQAGTGQERS